MCGHIKIYQVNNNKMISKLMENGWIEHRCTQYIHDTT